MLTAAGALAFAAGCGPSQEANSADKHEHEHGHGHGHEHEHGDGSKHAHDHGQDHDHKEKHGDHHEHGGHHEGKGHHKHPPMSPAVKSFHDVLSPVFHMEKGAARAEKTCGVTADMKEKSKAVTAEATDDAEKARAAKLDASLLELEKACAAAGRPAAEAELEKVHDAFHAVMEKK